MRPALLLMLALLACRREPPRVVPAEELPAPPAEVLHKLVAPGEQRPDDAVAEALLTGGYCYPLPGAVRRSLWWQVAAHRLEFTQQVADGHWQRLAVDLATGATALVEDGVDADTGLPPDPSAVAEGGAATSTDNLRPLHVPQGKDWLVRVESVGETLLEPRRGGPVPMMTVTGAMFVAAVEVPSDPPGSVVAALLRHDTDDDGAPSPEDEVDLCLVARAVAPVDFAPRRVPLDRVRVAEQVRALASAALAAPVQDRWLRAEHRLQLRYTGACALDQPQVTDRLVALHDAVTQVVGEVDLALEVRCQPQAGVK